MCLCWCEFEPYLECENTSRINVRLQYVWRELRGNLHPQVLLYAPHEGKNTELTTSDDYLCRADVCFRCELQDAPWRNQITRVHMNHNRGSSRDLSSHKKEFWHEILCWEKWLKCKYFSIFPIMAGTSKIFLTGKWKGVWRTWVVSMLND